MFLRVFTKISLGIVVDLELKNGSMLRVHAHPPHLCGFFTARTLRVWLMQRL